MKLKKLTLVLACGLALSFALTNLTACSTEVQAADLTKGLTPEKVNGREVDESFALAQTGFALDLFKGTAAVDGYDDLLISPLSVALALSMTANGANAQTLAEMENVLGLPVEELNEYFVAYVKGIPDEKNCKLHIANSLWMKEDFDVKQDFLQTNRNYYSAPVYTSPFDSQTLQDINNWVKTNTDGMIEKILNEINDDAVMYIANALAFDARWSSVYEKNQVRDGVFTTSDGAEKTVKFLHDTSHYPYFEDGSAAGFMKSYEGGRYAFAAILPNEDVTLGEYIEGLTAEGLYDMISGAEYYKTVTALPKFSYDYDVNLNAPLKQLGMSTAFDVNTADFSRLGTPDRPDKNIYIGRVLHKTFIAVDELGTKAGAATVVEMRNGSAAPAEEEEIKYVILDRPFLFMIIDREANIPLFIGTVTSP